MGVVVIKFKSDVRRQGGQLVIWQFRADAPGKLAGAKIIERRAG